MNLASIALTGIKEMNVIIERSNGTIHGIKTGVFRILFREATECIELFERIFLKS